MSQLSYRLLREGIETSVFTRDKAREVVEAKSEQLLSVKLSRFNKSGSIVKLRRGVYKFHSVRTDSYTLGAIVEYPRAYVSGESVLMKYGLLKTEREYWMSPVTLCSNVLIRSGRYFDYDYKFSRLHPNLFFGFRERTCAASRNLYLEANIEKAILDYLYLSRRPDLVYDLDLGVPGWRLNEKRYWRYAEKFPKWVSSVPLT